MAWTRRHFLASGLAIAGFGGVLGRLPLLGAASRVAPRREPRAQAVIHILLRGGLSQLDSFDPKPYAPVEVRGAFGLVPSKLDGEPFCELLARTAAIADRLCLIRSMTHGEAAHERGMHTMLTGYAPSPAVTYPSTGAVVAHQLGAKTNLPPYIAVPDASEEYLGTGYLGAAHAPFSVGGEPQRGNFQVRDLEPSKGLDAARRERRRALVEGLDLGFGAGAQEDAALAADAFYEQAYRLIESPEARKAFDIRAEAAAARDAYGRTPVGQRLLLARRLVEGGARYVAVMDESYDHHQNLGQQLPRRLGPLDAGFAALITDLEQRGLLASTLVMLTTEFGRTPQLNRDRGRDHWPRVFSIALAGGGMKAGIIHGASSGNAGEPERDPVSPADLAATVFHLLGIDPERKLMSPGNRPLDIVRDGRVLQDLLA